MHLLVLDGNEGIGSDSRCVTATSHDLICKRLVGKKRKGLVIGGKETII